MKSFILRACIPTFLSILLFLGVVFGLCLPALETIAVGQKREMIRELTTSAWAFLAKMENDVQNGIVSKEDAQKLAIEHIQSMHYGHSMKDYFWVIDMHPRMILHPYRSDLNGTDLTGLADPEGKRLFVDMVQVVKAHGSGFVDYMWQWQDDPTRILPKISFVKGFAPWNWIIGTGVYVDDIRQQVGALRNNLLLASMGVLFLASLLLLELLYSYYHVEKHRQLTEEALKTSEERYRLVVESSGECLILAMDQQPLFGNQNMLQFLGYSQDELARRTIEEILVPSEEEKRDQKRFLLEFREGRQRSVKYNAPIRLKSGEDVMCVVTLSPVSLENRGGMVLVVARENSRVQEELRRETLQKEFLGTLHFLQRRGAEVATADPLELAPTTLIGEAVRLLEQHGKTVALLSHDQAAKETNAFLLPQNTAVRDWLLETASAIPISRLAVPLQRVSGELPLWLIYSEMEKNEFAPCLISGVDGKQSGVLTWHHLLQIQSMSPLLLEKKIEGAESIEVMREALGYLPGVVRLLLDHGMHPLLGNRIITHLADAALRRTVSHAVRELGAPPVPFVFLVMGSQGRFEQTFKTDQDNAIVYQDVETDKREATQAYFLRLGSFVTERLEQLGYALCKGQVMASYPRWCKSLQEWKDSCQAWVNGLETEDLLNTKIFFDFRAGMGEETLVQELQLSLKKNIADSPRFLPLLARNVLQYQPPVGLFGNFILELHPTRGSVLDIKSAMTLLVDFARIYALKHQLVETGTVERLRLLGERGVISQRMADELSLSYRHLMELRLSHQLRLAREGEPPDNLIDPDCLTAIDQRVLKEVFAQIQQFQVRLSYDFTGMRDRI